MEKDFDISYVLGFFARRKWFFIIGTALGTLTALCYVSLITPSSYFKSVADFPAPATLEPEITKGYKKFASLAEVRAESDEMTNYITQTIVQDLNPSEHRYYSTSSAAPRISLEWAEVTNSLKMTLITPTRLDPDKARIVMHAFFLKLLERIDKEIRSELVNSPAQIAASSSRDFISTELLILDLIEEAKLAKDARRTHLDEVHRGNTLYSAAKDLVLLEKSGKISKAEADALFKKLYANYSAFSGSSSAKSPFDGLEPSYLQFFKKEIFDKAEIRTLNEPAPIDNRDRRIKGSLIMVFVFLGFAFLAVWFEFSSLRDRKVSNFNLNPKQQ